MTTEKVRVKKKLPKEIGMQIIIEKEYNLYHDKQRYRLEFLLNRELTDDELMILSTEVREIKKVKKIKEYRFWKLIFDELKKSFVCYVVFVVVDKDEHKEDVKDEMRREIENLSGSLKFLGCDVYKIKRFPWEKEKEIINIPEKKLLKILEK